MNKKILDFCIDESRIEQQIVMPYEFLSFFFVLIYSSSCVLVYMLT